MMRALSALCCLLVLGGCASGPTTAGPAERTGAPFASPATFTADTGAIEGTITDDSFSPLVDADIILDTLGAATTTDAGGRFVFSRLTPGTVVLAIARAGFESTARKVEIRPGEVTHVSVALVPMPANEPYHQTVIKTSVVNCGADVNFTGRPPIPVRGGQTVGEWAAVPCRAAGGFSGKNDNLFWDRILTNESVGLWLETSWRPTQALGNTLRTRWMWLVDPANAEDIGVVAGVSPLRIRYDNMTLRNHLGEFHAWPDGRQFASWKMVHADASAANPVTAAAVVDQRFDDYLTAFHGGVLPESFTALPEG